MDLTQGEFVDDFEFDVMVDGKIIKGYKSDTPHILRLRKEISDLPSEYDRENTMRIQSAPEKIARGVAGAIAGIGTGTWYGSQTAGAKGLNYLEKIGLGWASIFSEKVFGEESDLYKSIQDRIYNVSQMDNAINDTVIEIGKRNSLINKKIAEKLQLEDSFFTDLGSGFGSLIPSLGWLALTKNKYLATAMLTLPQAQNILSERLESGEDVDTALAKSGLIGLGIGILEMFGAQNLIEGLATKTILGGITKGFVSEAITESSQQALESFAQNDIRKQPVWQIMKDIGYNGLLGGIAGGAGAGVVGGSYALYKNKVIKDLKKANPDLTDEDSQMAFAYMHSLTPEGEQAVKELVEQGLTKDQASLVASFNERLLTDEKLRSVVVPPVVVKSIQDDSKDDKQQAYYMRQHLNEELDLVGYADESIDKTIDLIANTYNETLQKIQDESDIRGLVNIEGFKPKEKEGIENALQVFADAEAEEFGITQREVLESTGLTIQNLTERGDVSEEEIEEFYKTPMTPSENVVEVFDDGTYKTEDGYYHDSDGTVLFQKEQFDIADRINEIDKQERLAGVPMYDKETININGIERPVRNSDGNKIAESEKSLRMFYEWFGDSKVVDKQGKPLVVYHGTKAKFDEFNLGFENEGRMLGNGVYLTNSVDKANNYGNILMKPYVSLQNPLNINSENALKILAKEFKLAKKDVQGWFNYYSGDIRATLNRLFREYDLTNKAKEKGYDGIIYNNGLEIVAFSPNQIKSTSNRGTFSESENIYYQSAYAGSRVDYEKPYGKFDITNDAKQLLDVLRSGNLTTLPHELAHFFTINRIKNAIKFGKTDSLNGIMKFFNVNNPRDLLETERLERLAQMGVNYILENEAPTASLRRFFNAFKRFAKRVIGMWERKGFIDANKIPDEVRDFYDSLFGLKQPKKIDIQSIVEQKEAIIEALKKIKKGEKVNIAGLPISQVRELMKARNLSIPRLPQSLKTALIQYGGINLDYAKKNDLINIMGMQDDSQKNKMFKKDGAIHDEQSLIEFMELEGFIPKIQLSDYVDLSNQFDLAMQALDNINETYRIDDIDKVINRERVLESIEQAEDILKSLGEQEAHEIIDAIDNTLMGRSVVEKEYLESLKRRINNLDRDYKKFYKRLLNEKTSELLSEKKQAVKDSTQEIRTYRDDVIDFIKSQNLDSKDIVKLISLSKKANSKKTFENVLNEIFKRSKDMYKKEQARILSEAIQKEVKTKRPKLKEQKYDYEENKLFADLREWNKLTNEKAGILFDAMSKSPVETREDEIRLLFLNYKASGANASPELMNKLLEYIQTAKRVGMETRSEKEFQKKMELRDDKQTMLDALENRKGGVSLYIKTVSNLNSSLNALFGRDFANKYELDSSFNKLEVKSSKHIDRVVKPAMEVYDAKNKGQFLEKLSELGQKVATLTTVSEDLDTPLSKQGITVKLSKIEIMDIYNSIKNNKTRDDYYYWYGKKQIDNLISLLSQKELIFADMMMQSVNDRYDSVNKVFIDTYYTDLPRVDNYWMATSEHKEENDIMTLQQDYGSQSATPSFLKERVKTRVLPKPANAYQKYVKHIKGTFYVTEVAQKQAKLLNLIESLRVKNAIENKFDKNTYNVVHNQITSLSYGSQQQDLDFVSGFIDKVINNFVVAKIALGVPVFVGQLSSVILYSNSMNTTTWAKDFSLGVANPKKTIEFMEKYVGDYMKNRFAGGYDQTINMILKDSEKSKKFWLNPKHHYNMMNVLTSFVRAGDMGAVIFGGYPRLKNLLENNTEEEAVRQFILETERTQQSNIESTKSAFEKNKGLYRIFTAFKSFQFGMTRKIADDIISALNGDISSMQAAKTVMVGGVVSAAFYVFIKNLYNALVWGMDDDEELTDGIAENILMQNISIIPFVEEIFKYALNKYQGKYAKEGLGVVGIDDIFRSIRMLYRKKELDVFEWGEVISPFIEGFTCLPSGRLLRDIEKIVEKFE